VADKLERSIYKPSFTFTEQLEVLAGGKNKMTSVFVFNIKNKIEISRVLRSKFLPEAVSSSTKVMGINMGCGDWGNIPLLFPHTINY